MSTQNKDTNWVYVVSLSDRKIEIEDINGKKFSSNLTFVDVVEKNEMYFCPVGGGKGGWPKEPLNYIAFRYRGKLQSIHHIESYKIVDEFHESIQEIPHFIMKEKHILYKLGPAIKPLSEVKNGDRITRHNRVWVQIDTLLTSNTISEAWEISQQRKE